MARNTAWVAKLNIMRKLLLAQNTELQQLLAPCTSGFLICLYPLRATLFRVQTSL
jgi:hypothetical protein